MGWTWFDWFLIFLIIVCIVVAIGRYVWERRLPNSSDVHEVHEVQWLALIGLLLLTAIFVLRRIGTL